MGEPASGRTRRLRVCRVDRGAVRAVDPDTDNAETLAVRRDGTLPAAVGDPVAPAVGDWLLLDGERSLVLPRTSELVRDGADATSHGQVLAANVDIVVVAEALAPAPKLGRVERLLTLAYGSGASAVVVLTKADLTDDPAAWVDAVRASTGGVPVQAVSAVLGTGIPALDGMLPPDATLVVVGASGAGKSTLANALAGADVMVTGDLRRDGRGRHTTTHRELVPLPGGRALIDTPGLRAIGLVASPEAVDEAFADVARLAEACRFRDCTHGAEPGCAVLRAVADGTLSERRLASWRALAREARWQAVRADARLAAEERAEWKRRTRAMRGSHRVRP